METTSVTCEYVTLEGDNEWDYTMRRHRLPAAGGQEFMEDFVQRIVNSKVPAAQGHDGDFTIQGKVEGKVVAERTGLNKLQVRHIEDEMVKQYRNLRKFSGKSPKDSMDEARKDLDALEQEEGPGKGKGKGKNK